jgi:hypothetical protein
MSVILGSTNINYGETTTITVNGLNNITVLPENLVISTETTLTGIIATVEPGISTIFYINGYDNLMNLISFNETIYVNVTSTIGSYTPDFIDITKSNTYYTVNYNTLIELSVDGSISYKWYPITYLNTNTGQTVISKPLKNIVYTVYGTDPFNVTSATKISINVNTFMQFTPSKPTVYDGNLLNLSVVYNNININALIPITYTWKSSMFASLPDNCVNLLYGNSIQLHPYESQEYIVSAYQRNELISSAPISITVIQKPPNIIDVDIIPLQIFNLVISRNSKALTDALLKNKILSKKIINFYYNVLITAYRYAFTNKNGISYKVPWYCHYQQENQSNEMILSFNQQWNFFKYINNNQIRAGNTASNFTFLLNHVNKIYLEKPQKIYITPL